MAIDFTFTPEVEEVRLRVRNFMLTEVSPRMEQANAAGGERAEMIKAIGELRPRARELGLWMPHMPADWGGMELPATALAATAWPAGAGWLSRGTR